MARSDGATIREVYQQAQRIEDKLDHAVDKMSERTQVIESRILTLLEKQDERIGKIEEDQARQKGVNATLAAFVGIVFGIIGSTLQGFFFKK